MSVGQLLEAAPAVLAAETTGAPVAAEAAYTLAGSYTTHRERKRARETNRDRDKEKETKKKENKRERKRDWIIIQINWKLLYLYIA